MHCVIGVNERDGGSLYNTMLTLGPGGLLHRHRKLMPTHQERLFHGIGPGDDLDPVQTPVGRVSVKLIVFGSGVLMPEMTFDLPSLNAFLAASGEA